MEATRAAPLPEIVDATAASIAAPSSSEEPLASITPEPAEERLSWRFPLGSALVAGALYAFTRAIAPPVPPPEPIDFYATTPMPAPIGESEALPLPFITPPIFASSFYAKAQGTAAPRVRAGALSVNGRLPPEVIARILRVNQGRYRACYEAGLKHNPNLTGRVTARFVIGRDGSVSNIANGGSDVPDGNVVRCVLRALSGISFPQPEGGVVTVTYPLTFRPG